MYAVNSSNMSTRKRKAKKESSNETEKPKKRAISKREALLLDPRLNPSNWKQADQSGGNLEHGNNRLRASFFNTPCQKLARNLLGKILVRKLDDGTHLRGRIVETESYLGGIDKASHSYNGRITERSLPMFMKPGTSYVYLTYGMYHCFNISSEGPGAAVLLRSLEPLDGLDLMHVHRSKQKKGKSTKTPDVDGNTQPSSEIVKYLKSHELCNGPSKLCMSMLIERDTCNMKDLTSWDGMWIESDDQSEEIERNDQIITSTRIGIESVDPEWALKPLRFYLYGYKSVSVIDKKTEKSLKDEGMLIKGDISEQK